jgi:hypothetical protein
VLAGRRHLYWENWAKGPDNLGDAPSTSEKVRSDLEDEVFLDPSWGRDSTAAAKAATAEPAAIAVAAANSVEPLLQVESRTKQHELPLE